MARTENGQRGLLLATTVFFGALVGIVSTQSPSSLEPSAISPTACSSAIGSAPALPSSLTRFVSSPVDPFGVTVSPDNKWAFVGDATGLSVYSLAFDSLRLVRTISLGNVSPFGLVLTPNGRYLIGAINSGAAVFSASILEQMHSRGSGLIGTMTSHGSGGIEVAVSPDGHYVFVSLEDSQKLAVFDLESALKRGFSAPNLVGYVPLGIAPVGLAISPDAQNLYATSEATLSSSRSNSIGTLSTIDIQRAETEPARSVISTVEAGCNPVRVVASQRSVFVTARASDAVLEFSASALASAPRSALVHELRVGEAPVGIALVDKDTKLLVADSNRFTTPDTHANLALIDIGADGALSLRGYLRADTFPRDMSVSPDGRSVLVTNYGSGQIESVAAALLP